jgi:tripartite-type tricarboxylate transporter receptor subunit TctC
MRPALVFILMLGTLLTAAAGAQTYPAKPVRFISPFPPGGPTDLLARPVGAKLQEMLGQPFVIDYKSGASGTIGADHVAKSAPDGYTLLVITGSFTTAPSAQPAMPYDTLKDFIGVSPLGRSDVLLVANPRIPAQNLKALVALAKAQPGKLNYGSSGGGGIVHLGMEMFKLAAGINVVHVPYKGVAPALQDVIGGYVDLMFSGASPSMVHIKSGKLRALAVASPKRAAAFPDTPTIAEMGYPKFEIGSNYGIMAAAATPRAISARLNGALEKILAQPDIKKTYAAFGVEPWWDTTERFTAWIAEDVARWAGVAKAINYQPSY